MRVLLGWGLGGDLGHLPLWGYLGFLLGWEGWGGLRVPTYVRRELGVSLELRHWGRFGVFAGKGFGEQLGLSPAWGDLDVLLGLGRDLGFSLGVVGLPTACREIWAVYEGGTIGSFHLDGGL